MSREVIHVPLDCIRVVNPRVRDQRKFAEIVESIRKLGLKKPIQVSVRHASSADVTLYDLVCGQGRIEAFMALDYTTIPAIVVEASKEDRLLMSLVENMARRFASPIELVDEINRLKKCGYSNVAIAKKLNICETMVGNLIVLGRAGESRLIHEVIAGTIPLGVAIDIAKVESPAQQREFLEAFEKKQLNQSAIRTVKRVMIQRKAFGKNINGRLSKSRCTSAETLVRTFAKESQRQRLLIRKTKICEGRVMFIAEAMRRLTESDDFINLLRAERIDTMPTDLVEMIREK